MSVAGMLASTLLSLSMTPPDVRVIDPLQTLVLQECRGVGDEKVIPRRRLRSARLSDTVSYEHPRRGHQVGGLLVRTVPPAGPTGCSVRCCGHSSAARRARPRG